jgi:hypothetical protein
MLSNSADAGCAGLVKRHPYCTRSSFFGLERGEKDNVY